MKKFILYCFFGGFGVLTDLFIYYICVEAAIWYQLANVLGYLSGTIVSFFLNRKFTFKVSDQVVLRLIKFLGVALVGYIVSALLLLILIDFWTLDPKLSKIITLPIVVLIQFTLNRALTFKN